MKINVIIKEPGKMPVISEIDNELTAFQKVVGGYIETVTLASDMCIICNEEGRLRDLPYNCDICGSSFVETIIFCGVSEGEFCDVPVDFDKAKVLFKSLWEV